MYHIMFTGNRAHLLNLGLYLNFILVTHCCSLPNTACCLLPAFLGITCILFNAANNNYELYYLVHPIVQVIFKYEHSKHLKT
jgi:hypothetical protein